MRARPCASHKGSIRKEEHLERLFVLNWKSLSDAGLPCCTDACSALRLGTGVNSGSRLFRLKNDHPYSLLVPGK